MKQNKLKHLEFKKNSIKLKQNKLKHKKIK